MGFYEMNIVFALVIGALTSLSVSTFFRKGGPWTKRARVAAMWRLQTNRLKRKLGINRLNQQEGASIVSMDLLFWVLVVALVVTITVTVLQYL